LVTIKDVADQLHCSPTTISLILNNHPLSRRINPKTRERVLAMVERMGYVPNAHAKLLRQVNIHSIGIVCSNINDPYCTEILNGIMQYLNTQESFFKLLDVQNNEESVQNFIRMIRAYNIEGVVSVNNPVAIHPDIINQLTGNGIPLISIGRKNPNFKIPCLLLDNALGIQIGIEHLYELGHREIVFILGPEEIEESKVRWKAIQQTCRQLGLSYASDKIEFITDSLPTSDNGAQAIRRILDRNTSFSAVFAFDDWTAYGVILELTRAGISVPHQISVMGFDDIWSSRSYNPPLTTIRQPMGQMGHESARIMVEILNNKKASRKKQPQDVIFKPELIIRESTAAAPPGQKSAQKISPSAVTRKIKA
jgi:DNA-binding LacI/PurR family transcriptional regulator